MSMLKNPATKYRPVAPVRLTDRTWPDAVLTKAQARRLAAIIREFKGASA